MKVEWFKVRSKTD